LFIEIPIHSNVKGIQDQAIPKQATKAVTRAIFWQLPLAMELLPGLDEQNL